MMQDIPVGAVWVTRTGSPFINISVSISKEARGGWTFLLQLSQGFTPMAAPHSIFMLMHVPFNWFLLFFFFASIVH